MIRIWDNIFCVYISINQDVGVNKIYTKSYFYLDRIQFLRVFLPFQLSLTRRSTTQSIGRIGAFQKAMDVERSRRRQMDDFIFVDVKVVGRDYNFKCGRAPIPYGCGWSPTRYVDNTMCCHYERFSGKINN